MRFIRYILFAIFLLGGFSSPAQERSWTLNGYVKDLFMLYKADIPVENIDVGNLYTNTIHNRLNFKWYATDKLTFVTEMRNRLIMGNLVKDYPDYQSSIDTDNGFFDLSFVPVDGESWFLHSMIDRAYIDWVSGSWEARLGRQRINWGMNLVWNPNDLFNSFSYFDFDYEERPGTDGARIQYYTGVTSSVELVYKLARNSDKMALAAMYRFLKWSYDFQFLSGWMGPDFVAGLGWSGDIKGAGFRGELTQFIPRKEHSESETATVASVSADYTFLNSLYIHSSILFNSHGTTAKAGGDNPLINPDLSAKYLSNSRYSLFGQISYPVTPLFTGSVSSIVNPCDGSWYFGPALTYSIQNNLELMCTGQLFFGETGTEFGDVGRLLFARLKWSF